MHRPSGGTGNKAFTVNDPRRGGGWEVEIVVVVNGNVDDSDSDPGSIHGVLLAGEVAQDRGRRIVERRLVRAIRRHISDVRVLFEPSQHTGGNPVRRAFDMVERLFQVSAVGREGFEMARLRRLPELDDHVNASVAMRRKGG